jgi:hypothetical protein
MRRRLTIPALAVGFAAPTGAAAQVIDRLDAIGPVLSACVERSTQGALPHGRREVTFSVAFRSDGSIIGVPRRTHAFPAADAPEQADFIAAVANAIIACAPLPFSKQLGEATAGRNFRFRYVVAPRQDRRA